jgi:hypothetical protein
VILLLALDSIGVEEAALDSIGVEEGQLIMCKLTNVAAALATSACLAGCANQELVEGRNITLQDALVDTVKSLNAAREAGKNSAIGLNVCSVTVKFNVDAKATYEDKLGLTAGPAPVAVVPVPLTATASTDLTGAGERINTITVVLATANSKKAAICKTAAGGAGTTGTSTKGQTTTPGATGGNT